MGFKPTQTWPQMYDTSESLFYRDSRFFERRESLDIDWRGTYWGPVYYRQSGAHVIIDDASGEVIQLSNRFDPKSWIPDDSIVDPYIPGGG